MSHKHVTPTCCMWQLGQNSTIIFTNGPSLLKFTMVKHKSVSFGARCDQLPPTGNHHSPNFSTTNTNTSTANYCCQLPPPPTHTHRNTVTHVSSPAATYTTINIVTNYICPLSMIQLSTTTSLLALLTMERRTMIDNCRLAESFLSMFGPMAAGGQE